MTATDHAAQPFFSVVVPLFNKKEFVSEALESVLKQRCADFEIVVIDDGSTDGSASIVAAFRDDRIRLIQQTNRGAAAARNAGVHYSRGTFLAFLDADDIWEPGFLEQAQQDIQTRPDIRLWSCGYWFTSNGQRRLAKFSLPEPHRADFLANYFDASLIDPVITSSSVVMAKELAERTGGFPVGQVLGEDLLMWAKATQHCRPFFRIDALATYRTEFSNNLSRTEKAPPKRYAVLDELEGRFDQGDLTGLRYYVLYSRKNAYRQAKTGRAVLASQILCRSLSITVRHGRPDLAVHVLLNCVRLAALLVQQRFARATVTSSQL